MKYLFVPLNSMLTSYSISFFVFDQMPFARILPSGDNFFFGFFNGKDVAVKPWFHTAVEADGRLVWFQNTNQPNKIYAARLIKNPETLSNTAVGTDQSINANVGIAVIGFDISQLGKQIEASKLTPSTQLAITDDSNILYLNNSTDNHIPLSAYANLPTGSIVDYNQQYLMNRQTLASGWNLVALIPLNEISQRASVVRNIVGLGAIASLCIGILLSALLSNRITSPIRILVNTMNNVKLTGNLKVNLNLPVGRDEVSILYRSFNDMMRQINTLISEVYEGQIREKDAELRALQAQINPHFLYNTLDSINWLAMDSGNDQIVFINSALADLFRYTTDNSSNLVTLKDELDQVKNYVNIQSICYENRFEVTYNIEPDILDTVCPKLILQPLVENAILHGIEKSEKPGHIHISGMMDKNIVSVSIYDNGAGCNVDKLNAFIGGDHDFVATSQGYGIKNVNQRIKLKFGEDFGLRYENNVRNEGITAIITLPLSKNQARTNYFD